MKLLLKNKYTISDRTETALYICVFIDLYLLYFLCTIRYFAQKKVILE